MMRRYWVNLQFRGVLLIWIIVGQGPIALAVGAGEEAARYRLKYCLKGPLNPKQSFNGCIQKGEEQKNGQTHILPHRHAYWRSDR